MTLVLLVDGVSYVRALMQEVLEEAGNVVARVPDSAAALSLLRSSPEAMVVVLNMGCGPLLLETALREPEVRRRPTRRASRRSGGTSWRR